MSTGMAGGKSILKCCYSTDFYPCQKVKRSKGQKVKRSKRQKAKGQKVKRSKRQKAKGKRQKAKGKRQKAKGKRNIENTKICLWQRMRMRFSFWVFFLYFIPSGFGDTGVWPSGKASPFGGDIRRFESCRPSGKKEGCLFFLRDSLLLSFTVPCYQYR